MDFNVEPRKRYLRIPFMLICTYIFATYLISILGPVKYVYYTPFAKFLSGLYLFLFLIFTWCGMSLGMKYDKKINRIDDDKNKSELNYQRAMVWLSIGTAITLVIKLLLVASSIALEGLPSFSTFYETLAVVYTSMHRTEPVNNIFRALDTFTTFITYFTILGNLFIWKLSGKRRKVTVLLIIGLDLFYNLFFIGTQRSLFTYAIFLMTYFLVSNARRNRRIEFSKKFKAVVGIVVLVLISMNILYARKNYWNSDLSVISFSSGISYDYNNVFIRFLPDQIKYGVSTVLSYFGQGYYGLSLSLVSDFQWTFGIGSMRGLSSILRQVFAFIPDMTVYTYPLRVGAEYGFDGLVHWYSIFPWLASDYTFVGALIYMGIVAYIYMKAWIEVIRYNNILSFTLLSLLNIMYLFLVANHQLFISRGESLATVVLFLSWLFFGKSFNWTQQNKKLATDLVDKRGS